jgi:hypothetical protein
MVATKTITLSDGTKVKIRALTKPEWERVERIKSGGSIDVEGETLTTEALLIVWTITSAVKSPPRIIDVLFTGVEEGRIAKNEMIDLHNAIVDFTAERLLADVTPTGGPSGRPDPRKEREVIGGMLFGDGFEQRTILRIGPGRLTRV